MPRIPKFNMSRLSAANLLVSGKLSATLNPQVNNDSMSSGVFDYSLLHSPARSVVSGRFPQKSRAYGSAKGGVWNDNELQALIAGVKEHGEGAWKAILNDPCYGRLLINRTNSDLKDKWRVVLRMKRKPKAKKNATSDGRNVTLQSLCSNLNAPFPLPLKKREATGNNCDYTYGNDIHASDSLAAADGVLDGTLLDMSLHVGSNDAASALFRKESNNPKPEYTADCFSNVYESATSSFPSECMNVDDSYDLNQSDNFSELQGSYALPITSMEAFAFEPEDLLPLAGF